MQRLYSISDVNEMINKGKKLILAGEESQLRQLDPGHWIAGTIPYFMSEKGGELNTEKIFVNELPGYIKKIRLDRKSVV